MTTPDLLRIGDIDLVMLELTTRCNLRCTYCYYGRDNSHTNLDLGDDLIEPIAASLRALRVRRLGANGAGETTVHPRWHQYCRRFIDAGMSVHLITNFAKRFSTEELDVLSRLEFIQVSCDTSDSELFARLRRGADLQRLIDTRGAVRAHARNQGRQPPPFSWSCVVTDWSVKGLADFVKLGLLLQVRNYNFNDLAEFDGRAALDLQAPRRIVALDKSGLVEAARSIKAAIALLEEARADYNFHARLWESLIERIDRMAESGGVEAPAYAEPVQQPAGCTRQCLDPWRMLFIKANGDVLPCCARAAVGSLNAGASLEDIANCENIRALRGELLSGAVSEICRNCHVYPWVPVEVFRQQVAGFVDSSGSVFDGRRPDVHVEAVSPVPESSDGV